MVSRSLLAITITLCSTATLLSSLPAAADTPLNRATVQNLRNRVELFLKQQQPRSARKTDVMTPGDALQTYRSAMAELRFNDNSVARVGEQAIFQFVPNSRNLDLKKGTVMLFITPKQGVTRLRTPNAAAGIRGSALFARYNEDNGVTTVGALTNSNIEVCNLAKKSGKDDPNQNGSKCAVLKAGEMAYVYNDQIGVYKFDQKVFQETSPLFKDMNLAQIPEVKAEIDQALQAQGIFAGNYENTPAWLKLAAGQTTPSASTASTPSPTGAQPSSPFERLDVVAFPAGTPPVSVAGPPVGSRPDPIPAVRPDPIPAVRPDPTPAVVRPEPVTPQVPTVTPSSLPAVPITRPVPAPAAAPPVVTVPVVTTPVVNTPAVITPPANPQGAPVVDLPTIQPGVGATPAVVNTGNTPGGGVESSITNRPLPSVVTP
jgi:hypothetical protein